MFRLVDHGSMGLRHFARTTPLAGTAMFVGALIAMVSAVWLFSGGGGAAFVGLLFGGLLEASGPAAHDQWHLRRGETPHAMWGVGDARRPARLGGPRVRG